MNTPSQSSLTRRDFFQQSSKAAAASALDGIAESMSSVARLHKVVSRARAHRVAERNGPIAIAMGVPVEPLALLVAVEMVPDIFRTVGNVSMDVAVTAAVARSAGAKAEKLNAG